MAGSSLVLSNHDIPAPSVGRLVFDAVGDDGDGSIPPLALPSDFDGVLLDIITNPGTPAPTTLYDVTLEDADGFDLLGGAGANRSATVTERAAISGGYVSRREPKTLTIAGQSAVDAQTQIVIHYTQRV